MVEVVIVVREAGRLKPGFSAKFELPEVPTIGSYISINRPDERDPIGEDLIVRQVWWRLFHPITAGSASEQEYERAGSLKEIMIECDPAIGPYSSRSWRRVNEGKPGVEEFQVSRYSFLPPDGEPDDLD
jgi:hypothetical protein